MKPENRVADAPKCRPLQMSPRKISGILRYFQRQAEFSKNGKAV